MANYKRVCNRTFEINLPGIGTNYGTIYISGQPYASPKNFPNYIEGTSLQLTYQSDIWYNNMHFTLIGPVNESQAFSTHGTYTRYYNLVPDWTGEGQRNLSFSEVIGTQSMKLTWNDFPNSAVLSYQVWRDKGTGAELIGTAQRGNPQFVDNTIRYLPGGHTILYDVRAVYSGTASSPLWASTNGFDRGADKTNASNDNINDELKYQLSNYPNPFNPATRIEYHLRRQVTLH